MPTKAAPPVWILDPAKLEARRVDLGMTQAEVALRLGISKALMNQLEGGATQARLTADTLHRLTDILASTIQYLAFHPHDPDRHRPGGDIAALVALIAACHHDLTATAAAHALHVSPERLDDLAGAANQHLRALGLTIATVNGRLALHPLAADPDTVDRATSHTNQRTVTYADAIVLYNVIHGTDTTNTIGIPAHRSARRRLRSTGVIATDSDPAELSERAAYSLGLRR